MKLWSTCHFNPEDCDLLARVMAEESHIVSDTGFVPLFKDYPIEVTLSP